jgi:dCMP deaminase
MSKRKHWHNHFMDQAKLVSAMATCDRKHVGAVLVNEHKRIVATGFNGSPAGLPHCDDVGHLLKEIDGRMSCIRTLHAESNALDYAGREARGCMLYTTVIPCYPCAMRIINAGIAKVIYGEYYRSQNTGLVEELFSQSSTELACLGDVWASF